MKLVNLQTTTSDLAKIYCIQWLKLAQIRAPWLKNETIKSMVYLRMPIATCKAVL